MGSIRSLQGGRSQLPLAGSHTKNEALLPRRGGGAQPLGGWPLQSRRMREPQTKNNNNGDDPAVNPSVDPLGHCYLTRY